MTIQVACVVDRAYVPHCGVMAQSLIANTPAPLNLHVFHGPDVGAAQLQMLAQVVARHGSRLVGHLVEPRALQGLPLSDRFPAPEWYRLKIAEALPTTSKVLCLDCDLVAAQSIEPLWETPLGGAPLAAVTDPLFSYLDRRWITGLGLTAPSQYFNSGVLLLNLEVLRHQNTLQRVAEFTRRHTGPMPYPFQDALNAVCHRDRLPLHPRWNMQTSFYDLGTEDAFDPRELRQALSQPGIVHYLGPWKPWHYRCKHPLRHLYARYRAQTPWADWQLEGRTLKHRILRLLPSAVARSLARARAAVGAS